METTEMAEKLIPKSEEETVQNRLRAVSRATVRGARHILSGEMHEKLDPVRDKVLDRAQTVQSETGRKMDYLARQIRGLGSRIEHEGEAHLLARRLEETADYLRFRPTDRVLADARGTMLRHPWIPGLVAASAGFLAYASLRRLRR